MIPYIMYAALVTAVYFLFYRLLLHKETFFRLNRWFFLGGLVCSFALPLLPVPKAWSLRDKMSEVLPTGDTGVGMKNEAAAPDPVSFGTFTAAAISPEAKAPVHHVVKKSVKVHAAGRTIVHLAPKTTEPNAAAAEPAAQKSVALTPADTKKAAPESDVIAANATTASATTAFATATTATATSATATSAQETGGRVHASASSPATAAAQPTRAGGRPAGGHFAGGHFAGGRLAGGHFAGGHTSEAASQPMTGTTSGATTGSTPGTKLRATTGGAPNESNLTGPRTTGQPQPVKPATPGVWDWLTLSLVLTILYYGYLCGVAIFGINLLLQVVVIWYQVRHGRVTRDGIFRIVETRGDKAPCSFGRYIFINPNLYDEETYHQILTHEKVHARGRHSVDILLGELGIVLQWFNPFAWFFRRALEDNLEFLTDAAMINNPRINASNYQLSLLRVSVPHLPLSITSNYNQSLLKKRILMMHSKQSSAGTTWKYLFLVPLLSVMVCIFNHTLAVTARQEQQVRVKKAVANKVDTSSRPHTITERDIENEPQPFVNVNVEPVIPDPVDVVTPTPVVFANPNPVVIVDPQPNPQPNPMPDPQPNPMPNPQPNPMPNVNVNVDVDPDVRVDGDHNTGTWMATIDGDTVELTMRSGEENDNWVNTEWFLKSEFSSMPTSKSEFTVTREAGTLVLNGMFDGNEGFGHFTFRQNTEFQTYLKNKGFTEVTDDRMFQVFRANITKKAVEDLAGAGFKEMSIHELCALCAMKVDAAYANSWRQLGYTDITPHELVSLKALKIDGNYLKELKAAGFTDLGPHELMTAKSMDITPEYAQSWTQLGFKDLSIHDLAGLKSMKVDAAYLKELQDAGLKDLGPHELMSAKSMEIDAAYVRSWNEAGFKDLSIHELVGLKSQKVDAAYIQELKSAGLTDLGPHELMAAKSMEITPDYVRGWAQAGYKDLSIHELISLKSQHIDAAYIQSWKELGYADVPVHDLVALKSVGVERSYIKEMEDAGYAHLEPHELISFKSQNITPGFVKGFSALGFKDIPPHTLVALKSMEVTPDYITAMKNKGFVSNDLQEYIKLKTFK